MDTRPKRPFLPLCLLCFRLSILLFGRLAPSHISRPFQWNLVGRCLLLCSRPPSPRTILFSIPFSAHVDNLTVHRFPFDASLDPRHFPNLHANAPTNGTYSRTMHNIHPTPIPDPFRYPIYLPADDDEEEELQICSRCSITSSGRRGSSQKARTPALSAT